LSYHRTGIAPDIKIAPVYKNIERGRLEQLNFVNCVNIKENADNKAVLALNQRLARIGYISPDDITSAVTEKTLAAVEIFQKSHNLSLGISKIDYRFIEILNFRVTLAPNRYEPDDIVLNRALEYILSDGQEAEED
jgi:hypothetical protein